MKKDASPKIYPPTLLLAFSAFWAVLAGGYVSTEALALSPEASPWWVAIQGDAATPLLSHALVSLPIVVALVWAVLERKIIQTPTGKIALPVILLLGFVLGTAPLSQFKGATVPAVAEWLIYGGAFFATVTSGGRRQGPKWILASIFLACVLLSVLGIRQYGEMR
ncbi:MAG TPA: hypothetical protein VGE01_11220, partial [Fimbriimonas sp.]